MRVSASLLACAAFIALAALPTFGTGCQDRRSPRPATHPTHVEGEVRALLDRWIQSFESRDVIAARSVLANDDRFVWLEDGEARYQSADAVIAALASFPPGLKFSHELVSIRIVPMSDDAAWAQLATTTKIRQGERVASEFAGVVLMLAQRDQTGWRIVAAHTSTTKPKGQFPG